LKSVCNSLHTSPRNFLKNGRPDRHSAGPSIPPDPQSIPTRNSITLISNPF
jgi:hypothetical protein